MSLATLDKAPRDLLAELSTNVEPLSRTYDPPVRGPVLLASAGRGKTDTTFHLAGAVAGRMGVGVEVAGVLEPYPALLFGEEPALLPPDFESTRGNAVKALIERRLRAMGPGAEEWPIAIHFGDPAKTIARVASERDATMIVVGSGKHGAFDRLPGGERALHVLRAASCPVLAVAPGSVALPRTVIVGMDFSPASVRAARAALLLVAEGGLLVLVHVRDAIDFSQLRAASEVSAHGYETLLERWRIRAESAAAALFTRVRGELRPYAAHGITLETQTRTGDVLEELLGAAEDKGAQMIAVGTNGPGVVERFFVGSIATEVLRHSGRSVLIAPAPNPAECARLALRLQGTVDLVRSDDWAVALETFSARNDGRRVRMEVDDPDIGAQVQQSGFALLGVTYDHRDERVEVMMGDPLDRTRHLTRSIPHVDDVAILADPNGPERALRIVSRHAQTLVTFTD